MNLARALVVLALAIPWGCAGGQREAPAPADDTLSQLERLHRERPGDASILYVLAMFADRGGDGARALSRLRELLATGWDYALDDGDFPRARALPGYAAVAAELARREPRAIRGEVAFVLPERGLLAEGIAWDPDERCFYLGHGPRRGVVRVEPDGRMRELAVPGPGDMLGPLGMKVDAGSRTLWVASAAQPSMDGYTAADAGRSRLVAIDLRSGAARVSLPRGGPGAPSLLNDLAVLPGGGVVVTDSQTGALLAADLEATELRELTPPGTLESPNGIVASEDGAALYVADFFGLSVVDPRTGAARRLSTPPGMYLGGIDGLSLHAGRLLGIQNLFGQPRIWSVAATSAGLGDIALLSVGDRRLAGPTTGAVADGALWLLANPQLRAVDAAGRPLPAEQLADVAMLRVDL